MHRTFFLLSLIFILFAIPIHAAQRPGGEPEPDDPEPDEPDHPDEPNGALLQSTPLIYVAGLSCGVVWFHLSEILV